MTANHYPGTPAFAVGAAQNAHAAYAETPRPSLAGIGVVVAAHAALLALLASLDVIPLPSPVSTLAVELIPPAASTPQPEIVKPRPRPIEPKPQPRQQQPAPAPLSTSAASAPGAVETAPLREAPAPALAAAAPTTFAEPRFDADYLSNPAPAYPSLSRRMGEEGKAVLRVHVDAAGRPSQIELKASSGSPRLDQAAQDAVWRWKFIPAKRGDESIAAWVLVPIVFNLKH